MAKAKQKLYAIRHGKHPVTKETVRGIILTSWAEAEKYVKGVPGAEFQSFSDEQQAQTYLSEDRSEIRASLEMLPNVLYCYVDGSFNEDIPNYSFGLVCVKEGIIHHTDKGLGNNPDAIEMRQIGGELLGAITALCYAQNNNQQQVVILHDYVGVANHATGDWKRSNTFSETYYRWMQNFFCKKPKLESELLESRCSYGQRF